MNPCSFVTFFRPSPVFSVLLLLSLSAPASADEGYVYGPDHCYFIEPPDGWVLDARSGESAGIPMTLYPKGSSWEGALTVMYSRPAKLEKGVPGVPEPIRAQVYADLELLKKDSPAARAELVRPIRSRSGVDGELWKFSGDRWGNTELAAYFVGRETVNFFIMSSREAADYERSVPAFMQLVSSYRESRDCVPCPQQHPGACAQPAVAALEERYRRCSSGEMGRRYDSTVAERFFGDGNALRKCVPSGELAQPFDVYLAIDRSGTISKLDLVPETRVAKCLRDRSERVRLPPPPTDDCVIKIHLSFKQ